MDMIDAAAAGVAKAYGMTGEQMLQHIALGNIPHPLASAAHCGATDPRDDRKWCAENKGHRGDHSNFRADDTVETYRARYGLPDRSL